MINKRIHVPCPMNTYEVCSSHLSPGYITVYYERTTADGFKYTLRGTVRILSLKEEKK